MEANKHLDDELSVGNGGLVIQNARYGVLRTDGEDDEEESGKTGLPPRWLDVTIALQAKVQQSRLILNAGPKHHYDGFCDVDPEGQEERYLRVRYLFLGLPHEV